MILFKYVSLSNGHWVCVYANLSPKTKRKLRGYWKSIYPREYVRKLIAALEDHYVQHEKTT